MIASILAGLVAYSLASSVFAVDADGAAEPKTSSAPNNGTDATGVRVPKSEVEVEVHVMIAGPSSEPDRAARRRALSHALKDSLERLGTRPVFTEVSTVRPLDVVAASRTMGPLAVQVWIDVAVEGIATVYVTEGNNVFKRRLELGGSHLDPVGLDLIDVVVTDSVRSVLAGRPVGISREEFTRALERSASPTQAQGAGPAREVDSAPQQTAPATPTALATPAALAPAPPPNPELVSQVEGGKASLLVGIDYEAALLGAARIAHGPRIWLAVDGKSRFRLTLALGVRLPDTVSGTDGTSTHFETLTLRASVAYLLAVSSRSALVASFGAGLDLGRVRSTSTQADVMTAPAFTTLDTMLRPALGFEHSAGALLASLTVGVDLDLRGSRYIIEAMPTPYPIVAPWRVRPLAVLSAGFMF